jgi:hypothetical protein
VDVLRQLVAGEVATSIGNGQVIFLPGGMHLDEGGENVEIATLAIPLLLEKPGLELRTVSQGEAGQELAAVEISCPPEQLDCVSTIREPIESHKIGPYTLNVKAGAVARSN